MPPAEQPACSWQLERPPGARHGTREQPVLVAGDGSGGLFASEPRLRRTAWAWAVCARVGARRHLHPLGRRVWGTRWCAPVQQLGRGGGALPSSEGTTGHLRYVVASAYTVRGWQRLWAPFSKKPAAHRDIWGTIRRAAEGRCVTLVKVDSHVSALQQGAAPFDVALNEDADVLAGEGAAQCQAHPCYVTNLRNWDTEAALVRKRSAHTFLAAVRADPRLAEAAAKAKQVRPRCMSQRELRLQHARCQSQHIVTRRDGRLWFYECASGAPLGRAAELDWLRAPCMPFRAAPHAARQEVCRPADAVSCPLFGNQRLHTHHAFVFYAQCDMCACARSGGVGGQVLRTLAKP